MYCNALQCIAKTYVDLVGQGRDREKSGEIEGEREREKERKKERKKKR